MKTSEERTANIFSKEDEDAATFLADIRFHRSLWLPPDPQHGRPTSLRITYSDIGCQDGPAIIWCGGLFSSRYTLAESDELAKQKGVRMISPDKMGIGGSMSVRIEEKVKTWFDIIKHLQKTLSLPQISLIGHSSGAIYVLNTILHLRPLLTPNTPQTQTPYIAIVSPWVHPSHSRTLAASTGELLTNQLISHWYDASYLITRTTYPILGPSAARPGVSMKRNEKSSRVLSKKILQYAMNESVDGISQEALFCLRRGKGNVWGEWEDYQHFVPLLKERERGYRQKQQQQQKNKQQEQQNGHEKQGQGQGQNANRLVVDVFFAESDSASGQKGAQWFDDCWKKTIKGEMAGAGEGPGNTHYTDDWVDYRSFTTKDTTHETIMRPEFGVLGTIFDRVRELCSSSSPSSS